MSSAEQLLRRRMKDIRIFVAPRRSLPPFPSEEERSAVVKTTPAQTRVDESAVPHTGQPTVFETDALDSVMRKLQASLKDGLLSSSWPSDELAKPDGFLRQMRANVDRVAATTGLLHGENGLSHFLQETFFAFLNQLMYRFFPRETRIWKVCGKKGTGSTDWGLFVNGVLTVIVELKPTSVFSFPDMVNLKNWAVKPRTYRSTWSKSGLSSTYGKQQVIAAQMYAEFGAHPDVRFGVIINESVGQDNASAVLLVRETNRLAVCKTVFVNSGIELPDDLIVRPAGLMLALSLLPRSGFENRDHGQPPGPGLAVRGKRHRSDERNDSSQRSSRAAAHGPRRDAAVGSASQGAAPKRRSARNQSHLRSSRQSAQAPNRQGTGSSTRTRRDIGHSLENDGSAEQMNVSISDTESFVDTDSASGDRSFDTTTEDPSFELVTPEVSPVLANAQVPPRAPSPIRLESITSERASLPPGPQVSQAVHLSGAGKDVVLAGPLPPASWLSFGKDHLPDVTGALRLNRNRVEAMKLGKPIGSGLTWTVYRTGGSAASGSTASSTVFKIAELGKIAELDDEEDSDAALALRRSISRELEITHRELASLQGTYLPRVLGVFAGRTDKGPVWGLQMEDCGDPISIPELLWHERQQLLRIYEEIHRRGVIHNDAEPRNWLRKRINAPDALFPEYRYTVIDFGQSIRKGDSDVLDMYADCLDESDGEEEAGGAGSWQPGPYTKARMPTDIAAAWTRACRAEITAVKYQLELP